MATIHSRLKSHSCTVKKRGLLDICQERLALHAVFFLRRENATPINFEITMKRNVREQKIRERGVNHENHENIMPRKFGAIR